MKKHMVGFLVALLIFGLVTVARAETRKGMAFPKEWTKYKHIGSLVITDKNSPLFGIHHFYMNKKGLEAFNKGGPYPDGTIIVDTVYELAEGSGGIVNEGKKLFYPVMKKDSKAKDTGGWIWAAFSPDGKYIEKDVKKDFFECHTAAKESDYVFSKPLK